MIGQVCDFVLKGIFFFLGWEKGGGGGGGGGLGNPAENIFLFFFFTLQCFLTVYIWFNKYNDL